MLAIALVMWLNPVIAHALGADFYEDTHLQGPFIHFSEHQTHLENVFDEAFFDWDNRIDSLRLYANTCATLYSEAGFNANGGAETVEKTFYPQAGRDYTDHIDLPTMHGSISSIKLFECTPETVTTQVKFYRDGGLQGKSVSFTTNQADLDTAAQSSEHWGNRISSVQLGKNTCVHIYAKPNFSGQKKTLHFQYGETTDYLTLGDFDNKIQSFEIYDCAAMPLQATFYEEPYQRGEAVSLTVSDAPVAMTELTDTLYHNWDKRADSLRLHGHTCVSVSSAAEYDEADPNLKTFQPHKGKAYTDYMRLPDWHDAVSSVKVFACEPVETQTQLTFYDHSGLQGKAFSFNDSLNDLRGLTDADGVTLNNRASAFKLAPNTCATLYERPQFKGQQIRLFADTQDQATEFHYIGNFNNTLSSFQVYECDAMPVKAVLYQLEPNSQGERGYELPITHHQTDLSKIDAPDGEAWSGKVSSVALHHDTCIQIYKNQGYQGRSVTLYPKFGQAVTYYNELYTDGFDNKVQSVKVFRCESEILQSLVWMYAADFFNEKSPNSGYQAFSPSRPINVKNPFNAQAFNDNAIDRMGLGRYFPTAALLLDNTLSSIQVPPEVAAVMYQHEERDSNTNNISNPGMAYEIPLMTDSGTGWPQEDTDATYHHGYTIAQLSTVDMNNRPSGLAVKWMEYDIVSVDFQSTRITKQGDTFINSTRLDNFGGSEAISMDHGLSIETSNTSSTTWNKSITQNVTTGIRIMTKASTGLFGLGVESEYEVTTNYSWEKTTENGGSKETSKTESSSDQASIKTEAFVEITKNEYEVDYIATLRNTTTGQTKHEKGVIAGIQGTSSSLKTQPCPATVKIEPIPGNPEGQNPDLLYSLYLPTVEVIDYSQARAYDKQRLQLHLRGYDHNGQYGEPKFELTLIQAEQQVPVMHDYPPAFLIIDNEKYQLWVDYLEVDSDTASTLGFDAQPLRAILNSSMADYPNPQEQLPLFSITELVGSIPETLQAIGR